MVGYSDSNRFIWMFWDKKLKEVRNQKNAPHELLDNIDGKSFFNILEERFLDTNRGWLKNMEDFVYQTCRTLYENATENKTPFPNTWEGLLNDLPFDITKYGSFIEGYSNAKDEVISNYQFNLDIEKRSGKREVNSNKNLRFIFNALTDIVGFKLKEADLPFNFDFEEKKRNLSKKEFFQGLRSQLGGKKLLEVLKERNYLERKLVQILDVLHLPRDWDKQLVGAESLIFREVQINHALNASVIDFDRTLVRGEVWHVYQRKLTDCLKTLLKWSPAEVASLNKAVPVDWEKKLVHKQDLGLAEADYGNINTILGGKSLTQLRTDSNNLVAAQTTITTAQTLLGITDLTTLPNMRGKTVPQLLTDQQTITTSGKTLAQLIADSTAHAGCSGGGCPNPAHHTNYNTLQTKGGEYDRIHTKLSGKVSDSELQALLDAISNCSHSDYDALKSENNTLKAENTQLKEHKCDCDSKVAQKEKEIINKIITDLELSTERERENTLETVIAEIKSKINPPADNSQLSQLQTQLKSKEVEITELKKGNKSYLNLEKLVEQKQAKNQSLATAKNELESQLNEKQKELFNQVLKDSSEVRETTYKEEIVKVIESSLTSQGINSQKFRQEITALSSLTDIQRLSDKYSSQKLSEVENSKKSTHSLNIVLGVLSLGSLIALAYLLIKGFKKEMKESLKEKSGK